jgi:hypothetical protein
MIGNGRIGVAASVAALGYFAACSSSTLVQVPPRMDLTKYGAIGMIEFGSGEKELGQQASQEFLTALQAAQPGVPVLELGDEARVLQSIGADALDPETMRSIGEKYKVDAVIFGVLDAKAVKPKLTMSSTIESLSASAEIEGNLNAKMFEARTGATVWSSVARDRATVAALTVSGEGLSGLGADHPDDAHERLVTGLVSLATSDFRPTYVRRKD